MKTITHTAKETGTVYTLYEFTKEEFYEADLKITNDWNIYAFLLFTIDKEGFYKNVKALNNTVSKEKLIEYMSQANYTHVAYIDYVK